MNSKKNQENSRSPSDKNETGNHDGSDHNMSESKIEVINETADGLTGIIIDGTPYLYWLSVYKALGIHRQHAAEVILRLKERVHYIKFSKEEFLQFSGTVNVSLTVDQRASNYYFLTDVGWIRAITEISPGHMSDPEIARKIDALKDHIAEIYTRYKRGEVLSIVDEKKHLPGFVPAAVVVEDYLKQAEIFSRIIGVELNIAASSCIARAELDLQEMGHSGDLTYLSSLLTRPANLPLPAYLNATSIGAEVGLSPRTVNNLLEKFGYQTSAYITSKSGFQHKKWFPTDKGHQHGEFKPFSQAHNSGSIHSEYVWYWRESIIEEMKKIMFSERIGQQQLPGNT